MEQIVGEIEDEYDFDEGAFIMQRDDRTYTVKAHTTLEAFNEHFETDYENSNYDTIGGLILNTLGHMPERGERLTIGDIEYAILAADSRKIRLLSVCLPIT